MSVMWRSGRTDKKREVLCLLSASKDPTLRNRVTIAHPQSLEVLVMFLIFFKLPALYLDFSLMSFQHLLPHPKGVSTPVEIP